MKIIRLSTFLDFGGVEKRLTNIAHVQDENQWIFCAINKGGTAEKEIEKLGKRVVVFNLGYKIPNIITIVKLFKFFVRERPNVVHTSGAEANFHGIIAAKLAFVPVVIAEEVGIPKQSGIAKKIYSLIYYFSDVVVGNSKQVIDYLNVENNVSSKRLKLIPNPVIFPNLPSVIKNESNFNIISVSRLEPVKNIESMLRVVAKVRDLNYPVIYSIVGDGINSTNLKALSRELKLEDNVKFLGFQDNPYTFLLTSDLYVLTSFTEGFSNSLTEAMYCAVPSLTTRVGVAEELIVDNENGWIVNVNDDDALCNSIINIIEIGNQKRQQIGERGKHTVMENYYLQNHIDLLMTIYTKHKV